MNALWSLHVSQSLDTDHLLSLLLDQDPFVRAWSVQLLCEEPNPLEKTVQALQNITPEEASPVVRLYLASALQRMRPEDRWYMLESLLTRKEDTSDHNIPLMLWYALEPLVENNPDKVLQLVGKSAFADINQFVSRRLVDGGKFDILVDGLRPDQKNMEDLLAGILAALEGRTDIRQPGGWAEKSAALMPINDKISQLLNEISQQLGNQDAIREMLTTLKTNAAPEEKNTAIQQLSARKVPDLVPLIPALLENEETRTVAIRATAQYDDYNLGQLLIKKYGMFPPATQTEIINAMSSRPTYGGILARSIAEGKIPKRDIPAYVARQLRRVVGSGFVEIWGPIDEPDPDIQQTYEHYKAIVGRGTIDLKSGEKIFQTTCGPCHRMYDKGGDIGPELTGSNRTNLDYLLSNILEPNAEIQDDYRMIIVSMRDGRTFMGNSVGEDERQITLKIVGQEEVTLNKAEIQSTEVTPVSLMPAGLLSNLSEEEIADLLGYLMEPQI
ncbi:MAG: c-type cytochrome [Saprospiraceae bacterium]|nr:c-type cytochrome [Saprospiraceae bacterium]